ncbi:hypothetical protein Tco_1550194, partial [Tanacetum coccineum]
KARMVAQGYNQQEWIDYDETSAPVISKEVYVQQPRFENSEFPNHVCKLDKALYGFQIKQDFKGISIYQEKYVKDLPKKYDLADSALVKCLMLPPYNLGPDESGLSVNETLFRGMIGSLMYLTANRRDIQFSTCLCARCCQILGGKLVCWSAKKQSSMAMSSAEAEYVVAARCCAQVLWIKSQLANYDVLYDKVHFIRDYILKGDIELHFVPTELQLADIFTKPLAEPSFTRLVAELGMLNIEKEVPDKKKVLSDPLT